MHKPFGQMTSPEFEEYAARLARQIAGRPAYFWVSLSTYPAILILFVADIVFNWRLGESSRAYLVLAALTPLLVSVLLGPRSRGTLWSWWGTWAYVGSVFAVFLLAIWLELPTWARILGIGAAASGLIFRPIIAGIAIGRSLEACSDWRKRNGDCARLGAGQSDPVHVFCATDMHDGEHVFFCTNDVVYSPSFGIGDAGGLTLRAAVQASANFPLAFPPRLMLAKRHKFEGELMAAERRRLGTVWEGVPSPFRTLVLTDGGVRDNTALNWHIGRDLLVDTLRKDAERAKDLEAGPHGMKQPLDPERMLGLVKRLSNGTVNHLVAVNAAYTPAGWTLPFSWVPLIGEFLSLIKLPSVFYHRTNRRLVNEFRRDVFLGKIRGAMISIDNGPLDTARYIAQRMSILNFPKHHSSFDLSPFEPRARKVWDNHEEVLRAAFGKEVKNLSERSSANTRYFHEIIAPCRDEATHLSPTGVSMASKLMFHGYISAMTNLKILDDAYPLMRRTSQLDDFRALAEGKPRREIPRFAG
jgi:hypothetical protein